MATIWDANGNLIDPANQTVYNMGGSGPNSAATVDRGTTYGTTLNGGYDPVGPGLSWSELLGLVGDPIYSEGPSRTGSSTVAMNNPNTSTRLPTETGLPLNYDSTGGFSPTQVASMGDPAGATTMGYGGETSSRPTGALQGILDWIGGGGSSPAATSDPWGTLRLGQPTTQVPGLSTGTTRGPTIPGTSIASRVASLLPRGMIPSQITVSPEVHRQLMSQQVLQLPAAAAATAQGRNSYVNPVTNALMPTTDINGNIRNTYGDSQDIW